MAWVLRPYGGGMALAPGAPLPGTQLVCNPEMLRGPPTLEPHFSKAGLALQAREGEAAE